MIIWLLVLFCASPVAIAIFEGKGFKSNDKKRRNKAWVIIIVIIFMQALQFTTSYIQENENDTITYSLDSLNRRNHSMEEKINNLIVTHKKDSSSLAEIKQSLDSTNQLIEKSNLIYKNGKLVQRVVKSEFNLPSAKFNAPAQFGNGNTQNN